MDSFPVSDWYACTDIVLAHANDEKVNKGWIVVEDVHEAVETDIDGVVVADVVVDDVVIDDVAVGRTFNVTGIAVDVIGIPNVFDVLHPFCKEVAIMDIITVYHTNSCTYLVKR